MSFIREINEKKDTISYSFNSQGVQNIFYIKRESCQYDEISYIRNTIIWGIIKNNKFSLRAESGNTNIYQVRSVIFEILDDFEKDFVSDKILETYDISFSQTEESHETKCNFTYKSLAIKYGEENIILDKGDTITVFINKNKFLESSEKMIQLLKKI
jgi:hypothetical protein